MITTILVLAVLLVFSALFAGLTIGFMGLDPFELERLEKLGDLNAAKILTVRKHGHLLLTTLLLGTVAVNSVISILLEGIAGGLIAGFVATALIFLFGEVIPQALFARHALRFGAHVVWLVQLVIFVFYPICKPISWMLDRIMGSEVQSRYSRPELLSIIAEYEAHAPESEIDADEQRIARGSLEFSHRHASQVMTPNTVVVMLRADDTLDEALFRQITLDRFSRVPVYGIDHNDIVGILYLKDLLADGVVGKSIKDIMKTNFVTVLPTDTLDKVLNNCIDQKVHLCIVIDEFGGFEGIITLEDILEEIVGREILDEDDDVSDMRQIAKKKREERKTSVS